MGELKELMNMWVARRDLSATLHRCAPRCGEIEIEHLLAGCGIVLEATSTDDLISGPFPRRPSVVSLEVPDAVMIVVGSPPERFRRWGRGTLIWPFKAYSGPAIL